MKTSLKLIFPDENTCWQALLNRDVRYNGVFFYGVRSTGIYCRPTCPARRPKRSQVIIFHTCEEAEAAGFHPCRRCHPRQVPPPDQRAVLVLQVCRWLEEAGTAPALKDLAARLGVSSYSIRRSFKALTGVTPHQYATLHRIQQFKREVRNSSHVAPALYEAGYGSSSRLYEKAAHWLGMTPDIYRRGGKDMVIQYTIVDSYLGRMLVAATPQGICVVSFGEEDAGLEEALRKEYPHASAIYRENSLQEWVEALSDYLDGRRPALDLPLDVQATAFQWQVWNELRKIPRGETRTYRQIAEALGQPKAARAVGHACATNPVAVVNPCHRVVRSDGRLGGYRWGLKRKEMLLEREREQQEQQAIADNP